MNTNATASTPAAGPSAAGVSTGAHVATIIGAAALVIGPFLPWAQLGMLTASGMQKTDSEALLLTLLGALALIAPIRSLSIRRNSGALAGALCGVIALLLSLFYMVALTEQLGSVGGGFSPTLGIGIHACLAGSVLVIIGSVAARGRAPGRA